MTIGWSRYLLFFVSSSQHRQSLLAFYFHPHIRKYPQNPRKDLNTDSDAHPLRGHPWPISLVRRSRTVRMDTVTAADGSYQQVKAVIFDVDGTLADSWKLGFEATAVILDRHGIPPIAEEIYHDCTRYATPERLARHAGLQPGDDQFEATGKVLAQEFDDLYVSLVTTETAGFFPGMKELIAHMPSSVKLAALTNAAVRYAHAVLTVNCPVASLSSASSSSSSRLDESSSGAIYNRFLSIRGADNVPRPKPAPDGLWQVCQDLGLSPADCVYIGDSPSDAVAASAAGMPAVGVAWGSHGIESLQKAPFAHLCLTVPELRQLLPQVD